MPRRRTEGGAPSREAAAWRPIRLVRVDVDHAPASVEPLGEPGDRVWVEAVRAGHVVGLVEARLDDGGRSDDALAEVASTVGSEATAPSVPDDRLASAAVVVPTIWRRPDQLDATIASLDAMDYPDFEIVVVDNRPGDPTTRPTFPSHPRVRVVREPVAGISSARNRGVASTTGELVAFTDDDAVATRLAARARQPVRDRAGPRRRSGGSCCRASSTPRPSCGSRSTTAASASRSCARR